MVAEAWVCWRREKRVDCCVPTAIGIMVRGGLGIVCWRREGGGICMPTDIGMMIMEALAVGGEAFGVRASGVWVEELQ